jgi:Mg-chelatase subunit ChlD
MGNGAAAQGSFQEYVGGLRQAGLDVVFVIDATGSMGWLIEEVKERVRSLADWIRRLVPVTRFGVVAYRDDDDPEFLVRVLPLTLSVAKVRGFLDRLEARGGGDIPEGVDAGLRAAIEKVGWRPDSKRVIVIVGDAPPHPEGLAPSLALAREFRARGGTVTTVDVSFDANPTIAAARLGKRVEELETLSRRGVMAEFLRIAEAGGGDGATLEGDARVVRQLAVLIFGQRWAEAVRPLLGNL